METDYFYSSTNQDERFFISDNIIHETISNMQIRVYYEKNYKKEIKQRTLHYIRQG